MKRRRLSLTWVDFLVIAASILTFAAVASATIGYG
jgi:predicted transcriptional regulator